MIQDGLPDKGVAEGLRQRDPQALEAIIARFSREIFYFMRMILANVGNVQDVEECVSDLFVSIWQEYEAFDPARGSFRTWLTMRAKYLALDRRRQLLRRQGSTITLSTLENDGDANDTAMDGMSKIDRQRAQEYWTESSLDLLIERREQETYLRQALLQLSELDRQLIYMRYFRLASTDDMAAQTGLSKHAIDTRIWRARKHLKEMLREPIHGRI